MGYKYASDFFDFVDKSSGKSASRFLSRLDFGFRPDSILDVGCGRGVWLKAWKTLGATVVVGLDGDYVDTSSLMIEPDEFMAIDISNIFNLNRKFDLAQCLEVGEHIPESSADTLVINLTTHADVILFSSGTPGQGGEHHSNEQPISYWADKFNKRGFSAFDYPRTAVQGVNEIEPWYRFNTVLYANKEGQARLSASTKQTIVPPGGAFREYAPLSWRLRCKLVQCLPFSVVNILAKIKHRVTV